MLLRASGVAEEMDISAAEEKEEFGMLHSLITLTVSMLPITDISCCTT